MDTDSPHEPTSSLRGNYDCHSLTRTHITYWNIKSESQIVNERIQWLKHSYSDKGIYRKQILKSPPTRLKLTCVYEIER